MYEYGFEIEFPDEVMDEANNISFNITDEEISKRRDLRDLLTIAIDPIGIGKGSFDRLVQYGLRNVFDVDVRRKSPNPGYRRLRDYLWWKLRGRFENGTISIPNDQDLIIDLSSIKYTTETSKSEVKIGSKKEARKITGKSSDEGDALMHTEYVEEWMLGDFYMDEDEMNDFTPTMERQRSPMTGY